jgi:hypothetical protein
MSRTVAQYDFPWKIRDTGKKENVFRLQREEVGESKDLFQGTLSAMYQADSSNPLQATAAPPMGGAATETFPSDPGHCLVGVSSNSGHWRIQECAFAMMSESESNEAFAEGCSRREYTVWERLSESTNRPCFESSLQPQLLHNV